jgi:anaerobic magnesium-protoporphyrin IX monomethyl ester cyclase
MMSKKRVLLVNPPFYRLMNSHFNGLSLGLSYIAAVLSENGYYVKVYNADYKNCEKYADQREIFESYDNYKKILFNLSNPLWSEVKETIESYSPDIIGITMLTGTYKSAENIARIAKGLNEDVVVVVGGTHPTVLPEETIKNEYFDYVVRGEGEYTFLELVKGVRIEDILGLTYVNKNGEIVINPDREFMKDIDSIPFPNRDSYLNDTQYMDYGYVLTGRGCPFECTFCASKRIWRGHVRLRPPENVVEEVKSVYNKYSTKLFYFVDDTFTLNKKRTEKICELLLESNLDITWICDTRVDTIDEELLKLMKESGCTRVKVGVESGSERILKMVKKKITKKQIREAVAHIKGEGIDLTIYLMIGFPTETKVEMQETLDFAMELDPTYYSLSILAPYPGTEIYDEIIRSGIKLPKEHWEYFFHQSNDMILTDNIDVTFIDECLLLNEKNGKKRI